MQRTLALGPETDLLKVEILAAVINCGLKDRRNGAGKFFVS
jgi:hypothetical protein